MEINGQKFNLIDTFDTPATIPDCIVVNKNKLGTGHGEAKFYITSKEKMRAFYGGAGFKARCFILKSDLVAYMNAIKEEYLHPTQNYRGKDELPELWRSRLQKIETLDDIIEFDIRDQEQIEGPRGYVNSSDDGYNIIREISLPLVSYVSAMALSDKNNTPIFYWKLFADFDALADKANALVFRYGRQGAKAANVKEKLKAGKDNQLRQARIGQGVYRSKLFDECPFCPITMINEDRLLIASHIKPWAVSSNKERLDPKNGFILSPLYDKPFDRGFITFTDDRRVKISNWLSPQNKRRIGIKENDFFQLLPIDEERKRYLAYHRESVFKG